MDNISKSIGETLKRVRKERKISLDAASKLTGVSKAMLGQIERGESAPTVLTLWRISSGLKITLSSLLSEPDETNEIIHIANIKPVLEEESHKLEHLTSAHEAQLLQRQVYLPGRIKNMNESIYYSVDAIHRAIAQNCQISFAYFSYTLTKERSYRRSGQPYQISPWALTWDDENYYLIGYDSEAGILKHFRVDKMARLSLTDKKREGADLFRSKDMGIYSKKLFSMFGGEEEIVKLQFPNTLVGVVLDRFGKDTVLTAVDDEHFQISERIIVSTQFFGWLAGLDHKATIIAPESVRDAYRAHLRSLLG